MSVKSEAAGFYGWWLLPILCLVYSIPIGFALYGPPVIYTFMVQDLGWQRGEVNVGYSIIGIMLGMGALVIPWLINRFGPRKTLAIGGVVITVFCVLMAWMAQICVTIFGHSYPVVYWVICFFVGLGLSFSSVVPVQALVLLWFNVHRALALGLVLGGGAIGGFIYPQIVSNCIVSFGNDWRVGWYVIALACLAGAVIALIAVRNRPEDLGQHPDGLSPQAEQTAVAHARHRMVKTYRTPINWNFRDAVRTRALWLIVGATGLIYFLWQAVLTQTPAHMLDRGFLPTDPQLIFHPAFIYGLILACSIIGRLSISFLGEKIETRYLIAIAGFSLLVGGVLFTIASKDTLWAVYIFPLLSGFGFGAAYVATPLIVGNYFGAAHFPSISRITNPVNSIFQFMSPAFAGFMFDIYGNYDAAMLIGCVGGLIGVVLILFCTPPKPHKGASR
ncbi:MAG: MFS transporter [Dehalococcoidia bacterium]